MWLAIPLAVTFALPLGAVRLSLALVVIFVVFAVVEHARRVVLDPQHLLAFELLPAGQVVVPRLELELKEVGF